MRKILCVAEKNEAAKGIALILSRGKMLCKQANASKFHKIYHMETEMFGQKCQVAMTSVPGHLTALDFGSEMRNWLNGSIIELFNAQVHRTVPPEMKNSERTLIDGASRADTLVIWTDCDREGENIGAEIAFVCRQAPQKADIPVFRARFSEITPAAIRNALGNLQRLDENVVAAVDCRSELDLRIGAAFTRLQTLHLRQCFGNELNGGAGNAEKQVVSYGSCQFPTLGFIVERYKAIEDFISEPFWKLVAKHERNQVDVNFIWERGRLFDHNATSIFLEMCNETHEARVTSVTKKPKTRCRPNALDTIEMVKLCVRKLKMSAKDVMTVAEKLYSQGYISYPRTDTNKFPANLNLTPLVDAQRGSADWGEFANGIMDRGGPRPRNGNKSDEIHPPIHPLKLATKDQLRGNEQKVYELIVRHFLACCSRDATGQETKVVMSKGQEFTATGFIIEDLGYMEVFAYDKWNDQQLPAYSQGELLTAVRVDLNENQTRAPPLLNEADLIALMDKYGIGTDATHAEHIETIKRRHYAGLNADSRFAPGYLGLVLVDGYDRMGHELSKPTMRAELELNLKEICAGRKTKNDVLADQIGKYKRIFTLSENKVEKLSESFRFYLDMAARNNHSINNIPGVDPPGRKNDADSGGQQQVLPVMQNTSSRGATRGRGRGKGRGRGRGRGGGPAESRAQEPNQPPPGATAVKTCRCNQPAIQKRVYKEGPNKGKMFWSCPVGFNQPGNCKFFEWA